MQHGELRTDRCPWLKDKLLKLSSASTRSESSRSTVWVSPSHEPAETEKTQSGDNETVRETRCVICQKGSRNSHKISSTKVFQYTRTHPRVLLVNQPSEPRRKVVSGKHSIKTHFPKDRNLRYLHEDQDNKGSLQKKHWRSHTSSRKLQQITKF